MKPRRLLVACLVIAASMTACNGIIGLEVGARRGPKAISSSSSSSTGGGGGAGGAAGTSSGGGGAGGQP